MRGGINALIRVAVPFAGTFPEDLNDFRRGLSHEPHRALAICKLAICKLELPCGTRGKRRPGTPQESPIGPLQGSAGTRTENPRAAEASAILRVGHTVETGIDRASPVTPGRSPFVDDGCSEKVPPDRRRPDAPVRAA
jgi:hypothetical protein